MCCLEMSGTCHPMTWCHMPENWRTKVKKLLINLGFGHKTLIYIISYGKFVLDQHNFTLHETFLKQNDCVA